MAKEWRCMNLKSWISSECQFSFQEIYPTRNILSLELMDEKFVTYEEETYVKCIYRKIYNIIHNLKTLPKEIWNLTSLTNLNLKNNNLHILPKEISQLLNLTSLDVSFNNITDLPYEIGSLINLTNLDASNNFLNTIPSVFKFLKKLDRLILRDNCITYLPKEFGMLHSLEILDLSDNNLYKSNISMIGKCTMLMYLNLSNNTLSSLPHTFKNLKNLNQLFLTDNKFDTVPKNCFLSNLTHFDISYNNMETISDDIINVIISLQHFNVSCNKLSSISDKIYNLKQLITLDLSYNQLTNLPVPVANLEIQYLFLNNNQLSSIPIEVVLMTHLISLEIDNNPSILVLHPDVTRLIDRLYRTKLGFDVYDDNQSVHNSTIQSSTLASIARLLSIIPTTLDVITLIKKDTILTPKTKKLLLQYNTYTFTRYTTIGDVTFSDVLIAVWNRIIISEHSNEIKRILVNEMKDSMGLCFTGILTRLVNCLSGFDPLVIINICESEQIGTVITLIKHQLEKDKKYSATLHKTLAFNELTSRGLPENVINKWIEYIE